ncbi:hypothetical protein RFI_07560 [Reticulomyxa filosa]|uniref:Adenosine kinase n=1 Tax=Reticulomyxa filosa TaxID=46433 RepID=X6NUT7_RETFI|nr:hypothetical protein RFI_07560 [Reticulomyxa filosa]|eukprot:ETO29559.1 hypothetical protein RFI_07560 [Reticulomyxa filosa]
MLQKEGVTAYFGCISTDKYGEILEKCASQDGVLGHFMKVKDVATGTCAVCIVEKERCDVCMYCILKKSLVANLSAANKFDPSHLKDSTSQEILSNARIVYSAGFFLTVSPESALICAEHCLAKDKAYAMNFSAEFIVEFFKDRVLALIPYATHIFTNKDEVKKFVRDSPRVGRKDFFFFLVQTKNKFSLIVTQGSSSVLIARDGKSKEYPVEKIPAEKIVDTNGAGDAFVGGFLFGLAEGKSEEECVNAGCYAAQVIIQTSGTRLSGKPKFVFKTK